MATVALSNPNHNEATDMMKKLSLETQPKALEISDPSKKVDSGNGKNGQNQSNDRSMTPFLQDFMDPSLGYMPNYHPSYYFRGYDGAATEWDRYANPEGVDLSQVQKGVFGDNGGLVYPHFYSYVPYSPAASPVPSVGHDGQLYGANQYQYPSPFYQPLNATSPPYNPTPAAPVKADKLASVANDKDKSAPLAVETAKGNANATAKGECMKGLKSVVPAKLTYQNSTFNSGSTYGKGGAYPMSGFQDPRFGLDCMRSPIPWSDMSPFPDRQPKPYIHS